MKFIRIINVPEKKTKVQTTKMVKSTNKLHDLQNQIAEAFDNSEDISKKK